MTPFSSSPTGDEIVKAFAAEAQGKTVLITGPSENGIGAQTAIFLAAGKPRNIILAGRNRSKIQPVMDRIRESHPDVAVAFVGVDLGDLASVRESAREIGGRVDRLDIVINNAGVMAIKDYTTTVDGIETQFAINHVGHFLLTNLLMGKIIAAGPGARIVNVSSFGYISGGVWFDDWNFNNGADYDPWYAYSQSKTANILFTHALADKLKSRGVLSFVLNPGLILESKLMTNVTEEMFAEGHAIATKSLDGAPMPNISPKTLAEGASTSLYAALDPGLRDYSGAFLDHCAVMTEPLMPHATGVEKQEKLWALSEKLVGQRFL